MSVGQADVCKALNAAWDASGLDAIFKALWPDPTSTEYEVLHDEEASPGQAYPYCVCGQLPGKTSARMCGGVGKLCEVHGYTLMFTIHAKEIAGDDRSVKEIAAYLAGKVMEVFGGHPTVSPTETISIDNGYVLPTSYQTDYAVRVDDAEYSWIVTYLMRTDVPIML
jgi:hypothetical protein